RPRGPVGPEEVAIVGPGLSFESGPAGDHGMRLVHSSELNFVSTSSFARASSSSEYPRRCVSYSDSKCARNDDRIWSRGSWVWERSGSTRLLADLVPLSDIFSRPMRSTSSIL